MARKRKTYSTQNPKLLSVLQQIGPKQLRMLDDILNNWGMSSADRYLIYQSQWMGLNEKSQPLERIDSAC